MNTIPAGSTWSNRTADGKLFKNLGTTSTPKLPLINMLKWQWQRLTNDQRRKPLMGYDAFKAYWCKPCNIDEQLTKLRSSDVSLSKDYVYWLGHASSLLCLASGVNVLFDPIFSKCAAPYSFLGFARRTPAPCTVAQLPHINLVAISHNHYDHLDEKSIRDVYSRFPDVQFCVPLQMDALLLKWGIPASHIHSFDWWQEKCFLDKLIVACTPAQHWSLRWPGDRNKVLWCGWYIAWLRTEKISNSNNISSSNSSSNNDNNEQVKLLTSLPACRNQIPHVERRIAELADHNNANAVSVDAITNNNNDNDNDNNNASSISSRSINYNDTSNNSVVVKETTEVSSEWNNIKAYYFTGDTAFNSMMFDEIHRRYPVVDMAALPIGAYAPRFFMSFQHMDPSESVEVFTRVQAKQALAVHWGTFELADDPLDEPPEVLHNALVTNHIDVNRFRTIPIGTYIAFESHH